ncbi:MAG TPA: hypothetical protein VGS21_10600 [Acidimicrobiales bacterium]|nr:hypothetical protein [Acidimicrobiales bacterium]
MSVAPATWDQLGAALSGGALAADFARAFDNGAAFLRSRDGLRGRRPLTVEWKGSHKAPGDEVAPIDLRVDHVYLVSCKYLSKITINASPANLIDRLLQGGHGARSGDWFEKVAPKELQALYEAATAGIGPGGFPERVDELRQADRQRLRKALESGWPGDAQDAYVQLLEAVAVRTAERWQSRLDTLAEAERILWRMLRIGSAPYFMLGAAPSGPLRLRIATPWDWRTHYRLLGLTCSPQEGGQPRIGWSARVEDRLSGEHVAVEGHVEVRWSHGRFGGQPEAKVYLDTSHEEVPGYFPLDPVRS